MKLTPNDANELFDILEDTIAPHPELSTRDVFVEMFTTQAPPGYMILDDDHRVFIVEWSIEDDETARFTVRTNAVTPESEVLHNKLFNADRVLGDLLFQLSQ